MDATSDNKIFKATDRGHQLTREYWEVEQIKKIEIAIKPPLPMLGNSKCIGIKMIKALHTCCISIFSVTGIHHVSCYKIEWIRWSDKCKALTLGQV